MLRYPMTWLILVFLSFAQTSLQAQDKQITKNAITVKFFGLSLHLKESPYPDIFPNRLDDKGYLTFNYGAIVGFERFVYRDAISVRVEQGLYADCAGELAGFTHLGWRGIIFRKNRHSLNGGIGPTLVYRQDWNRIEGYQDDGYFKRNGIWQYKFYWYGGEFEYNYQLDNNFDLSVNLVPGLPELVSLGVGIRKHF